MYIHCIARSNIFLSGYYVFLQVLNILVKQTWVDTEIEVRILLLSVYIYVCMYVHNIPSVKCCGYYIFQHEKKNSQSLSKVNRVAVHLT